MQLPATVDNECTGIDKLADRRVDIQTTKVSSMQANVANNNVSHVSVLDRSAAYLESLSLIGRDSGLILDDFPVCAPDVAKADASNISRLVPPVNRYLADVYVHLIQ